MILFDWDGHRLFGHDGDTIGQHSRMRILPEANLVVCLLANGSGVGPVFRTIFNEIFSELAGIRMPDRPVVPESPPDIDLSLFAGTYERLAIRYDLEPDDGKLVGTVTVSGPLAKLVPNPVTKIAMTPVDETTFLVSDEESPEPSPAVFYEFAEGRPRYLHSGARANRRVGD